MVANGGLKTPRKWRPKFQNFIGLIQKFSKIVSSLFEEISSWDENYLISTLWDLQLLFRRIFCARYIFLQIWKNWKRGGLNPQKGGSNTFLGVDINLMWKNTSKYISPAILVLLSQTEQSKPCFVKQSGRTDGRTYGRTDGHTDGRTYGHTDGGTYPVIESLSRD